MRSYRDQHILNCIKWFTKIVPWYFKTLGHKSKHHCNTVVVGKMNLSLSFLRASIFSGSTYDKCLLVNVFFFNENFQSASPEKPQTAQTEST